MPKNRVGVSEWAEVIREELVWLSFVACWCGSVSVSVWIKLVFVFLHPRRGLTTWSQVKQEDGMAGWLSALGRRHARKWGMGALPMVAHTQSWKNNTVQPCSYIMFHVHTSHIFLCACTHGLITWSQIHNCTKFWTIHSCRGSSKASVATRKPQVWLLPAWNF